jgi:hypothetical protein
VEAVLDRLVAAMEGRRAVADSIIDQYWLETLADAAGEQAPFMIDHVSTLLNEHGAGESRIASAVAYADLRHPERHRAAADAAWLSTLLDHIAGDVQVLPALPMAAMQRQSSMSFSNNL